MASRVKEARTYGAFVDAKDIGDLSVGHVFDIVHDDHGPVVWCKFLECLMDLLSKLADHGAALGRILMKQFDENGIAVDGAVGVIEAEIAPFSRLLQEVEGQIDGDAINPCVEGRLSSEFADGAKGPNEGFLCEIVGVVVIARHLVRDPVDPVSVAGDELVERREISLPALLNQFRIAHGRLRLRCYVFARLGHGRWDRCSNNFAGEPDMTGLRGQEALDPFMDVGEQLLEDGACLGVGKSDELCVGSVQVVLNDLMAALGRLGLSD